jgi:hypothetical protein
MSTDQRAVVQSKAPPFRKEIAVLLVSCMTRSEIDANAALICAAPDLLAALKAFIEVHDGDRWLLWPALSELLPVMRAAIERAECQHEAVES